MLKVSQHLVMFVWFIFEPPFAKQFALCYRTVFCHILYVCLSETLENSGQMLGWINIPLGTNVGFRTGHIVLDGDPAPLKGAQ